MSIEGYELDGPDATEGVVPARRFRRQRKGWRYWQQRHIERGLRTIQDDWKVWAREIEDRRAAQRELIAPAQVRHFRALDKQRVREIEQLKEESAEAIAGLTDEIARLEGLLRDAGIMYWAPVEDRTVDNGAVPQAL